jgi:hypothetical protein
MSTKGVTVRNRIATGSNSTQQYATARNSIVTVRNSTATGSNSTATAPQPHATPSNR